MVRPRLGAHAREVPLRPGRGREVGRERERRDRDEERDRRPGPRRGRRGRRRLGLDEHGHVGVEDRLRGHGGGAGDPAIERASIGGATSARRGWRGGRLVGALGDALDRRTPSGLACEEPGSGFSVHRGPSLTRWGALPQRRNGFPGVLRAPTQAGIAPRHPDHVLAHDARRIASKSPSVARLRDLRPCRRRRPRLGGQPEGQGGVAHELPGPGRAARRRARGCAPSSWPPAARAQAVVLFWPPGTLSNRKRVGSKPREGR